MSELAVKSKETAILYLYTCDFDQAENHLAILSPNFRR